jgi:hypothetical protein
MRDTGHSWGDIYQRQHRGAHYGTSLERRCVWCGLPRTIYSITLAPGGYVSEIDAEPPITDECRKTYQVGHNGTAWPLARFF